MKQRSKMDAERILNMWAGGMAAKEIGKRVGEKTRAVFNYIANARRYDDARATAHPNRNNYVWTNAAVAMLREMWAGGYSAPKIAAALGGDFTAGAVISMRWRLGLPARNAVSRPRAERGARLRKSGPVMVVDFKPRERPLPPDSAPVSLLDRKENKCAWVIGETKGPQTMFCGAPILEGSWCAYHCTIGFTAPYVRNLRVPRAA